MLKDVESINLGAVYETAVANELAAHRHNLFYYDNRNKGEVDFLIDDYKSLSVLPIEVKSGRDYSIHSALNNLLKMMVMQLRKHAYSQINEKSNIRAALAIFLFMMLCFYKAWPFILLKICLALVYNCLTAKYVLSSLREEL